MAKKILVIDDEKIITLSLQKPLSRQGYDVDIAQDASAALQKIKDGGFDLIVSDVRMPGMDGVQSIIQIRNYLKESKKQSIPGILITGYADIKSYEEAKELNVAGYVYKPFDNDEFLRITEEILN